MVESMSDNERPLVGSRAVHRNPLCAGWRRPSDEKNCLLRCCTAVAFPADCCVLQMLPGSLFVNLTGVFIAGNQAAGDEVHCWAIVQPPLIVVEDAALLLGFNCRPKLNWSRCMGFASYNQDPCKVLIQIKNCIAVLVHHRHHHMQQGKSKIIINYNNIIFQQIISIGKPQSATDFCEWYFDSDLRQKWRERKVKSTKGPPVGCQA